MTTTAPVATARATAGTGPSGAARTGTPGRRGSAPATVGGDISGTLPRHPRSGAPRTPGGGPDTLRRGAFARSRLQQHERQRGRGEQQQQQQQPTPPPPPHQSRGVTFPASQPPETGQQQQRPLRGGGGGAAGFAGSVAVEGGAEGRTGTGTGTGEGEGSGLGRGPRGITTTPARPSSSFQPQQPGTGYGFASAPANTPVAGRTPGTGRMPGTTGGKTQGTGKKKRRREEGFL